MKLYIALMVGLLIGLNVAVWLKYEAQKTYPTVLPQTLNHEIHHQYITEYDMKDRVRVQGDDFRITAILPSEDEHGWLCFTTLDEGHCKNPIPQPNITETEGHAAYYR